MFLRKPATLPPAPTAPLTSLWTFFAELRPAEARFASAPPMMWFASTGAESAVNAITHAETIEAR
jgi:hypothetical protein